MADHRPDIYTEGDTLILRASSLGFCDTRLVASALGMEPMPFPDFLLTAFAEGADAEDALIRRWLDDEDVTRLPGYPEGPHRWKALDPAEPASYQVRQHDTTLYPHVNVEQLDDEQFTASLPVGGRRVVRGHLDGIAQCYAARGEGNGDTWLGLRVFVEAKFLGPDYLRKWLKHGFAGFDAYATQFSVYGHATGLPGVFVVGEKLRHDDGTVTIGRVFAKWVDGADLPVPLSKIKVRALKLGVQVENGEVPVCTRFDYPCPFNYLEDKQAVEVQVENPAVELKPDHAEQIKELAILEASVKAQEKDIKAQKEQIKNKLDQLLDQYRTDGKKAIKVGNGDWEVTWNHVEVPESEPTVRKAHTRSYPTIKALDPALQELLKTTKKDDN